MKKLLIILSIFSLLSCEKVIDKQSLDKIDNDLVWEDAKLANLYLNSLYSKVIPGFSGSSNTKLGDESTGTGEDDMMYGSLTEFSNYGNFGTQTYNHIRQLNILITDIETGSISEEDKDIIKAQAYFLRAWKYWSLVLYYGGVPLVLDVQDPADGEALWTKRNSARECVDAIVTDLDLAIESLPDSWPGAERGRITRSAAAAFKGRVLLFYASPQFNPDNISDRWQTAYNANKAAKDLCEGDGYALYKNYDKIFLDEDKTNEALMLTVYDGILKHHTYENSVRPGSENNSGTSSSNPTWDLVSAYPMADGFLPGESPTYTYDKDFFWKNRDPRFYSTIAYNGCNWELSKQSGRKQWNYVGSISENKSSTNTGFYCRKNVDVEVEKVNTPKTQTDWIEIRLAEVYLNLAECAAELNLIEEARTELKTIRQRAGIEAGNGSYGIAAANKADMIDAVLLERQIELSFENKRHWDLRRRNLFKNRLNGTRRTGIITTVVMPDSIFDGDLTISDSADSRNEYLTFFNNNVVDTINLETDYYTYFETEFDWERDGMDINFLQPKYNFYFIPQSDLDKNPNLQQTIHWGELDPFDPLAD